MTSGLQLTFLKEINLLGCPTKFYQDLAGTYYGSWIIRRVDGTELLCFHVWPQKPECVT